MPYRTWIAKGYTAGFVEIDSRIFDSYAATIVKRSREMGSSADEFFPELVQAARNWESVRSDADQILSTDFDNDDAAKAAPFVYHMCRNHRHEASARGLEYDMPHAYYDLAGGSIERITGQFLWDSCRRWKFEVFSDFGRWAHQAVYDIQACTEDKVECKKEARRCFGSCSGVDGSEFNHDFATTVALTELSEFVLGDGFDSAAAADCVVKTYVFKVPTFAGGDSFKTWAARLQTRSGMTAVDTGWCERSAASCAVIQRVLERSPQLAFVNGEFRHVYSSVAPSPPPPPLPPPRLFLYAPQSPLPPPPPGTPPPFYADAEQCIPLPRLADFGLDLGVDAVEGAPMEERASCLFVRRIAEERRRASACFSRVASPDPPPPPPTFNVTETSGAGSLRAQRERLGDLEKYEEPRRTDTAQWSFDKSGALDGTRALINSLGETNPVLKSLLDTAMDEIETAAGRRLMQRVEYETYMTDVLVTHELMTFYGKGGIPGLTYGSCLSLCEATKQDERAKHTEHCNAIGFKRAAPFSYTDQTGWCFLLQNAGGCKMADFSAELLTRCDNSHLNMDTYHNLNR